MNRSDPMDGSSVVLSTNIDFTRAKMRKWVHSQGRHVDCRTLGLGNVLLGVMSDSQHAP